MAEPSLLGPSPCAGKRGKERESQQTGVAGVVRVGWKPTGDCQRLQETVGDRRTPLETTGHHWRTWETKGHRWI
ncbi:hypothetical protein AV530_011664 [Patagioenas fasciata monilis]|uniref:Uncharacterized protein n=1 Tax=Patagioenas fasciata monilis TaxID=372326 RepID=A0A1V4J5H4_PATFA|nr:hypothetical protein AV530_011664 [Patagioenas fasciata monilis]